MSVTKGLRDYGIFGTTLILGILGNLLAEFLIASWYPNGVIPLDKASTSISILLVGIIIDVVMLGIIIMTRPSD